MREQHVDAQIAQAERALADLRARQTQRYQGTVASSARTRIRERFATQFSGRPLPEKVRFARMLSAWLFKRIVARFKRPNTAADQGAAPPIARAPVAFLVPGAIGDLVNASVFLEAFVRTTHCGPVDVFYKNVNIARSAYHKAPWLATVFDTASLPQVERTYLLVGEVSDIVAYRFAQNDALAARFPAIAPILAASEARRGEYRYLIDNYPFLLNPLTAAMTARGIDRIGCQFFFGGMTVPAPGEYQGHAQLVLDRHAVAAEFGIGNAPYITVHDGFDNELFFAGDSSPKQWPIENWTAFVAAIKAARPDLKVVQIGARRSRPIPNVDASLIGRTSIDQAFAVLAGSRLHIDGESGLVRAGWALGVRSLVMYGPTPRKFLTLGDNLGVDPVICGDCYWLSIDWMMRCPRELTPPVCMNSIQPDVVARVALEGLNDTAPAPHPAAASEAS